MPGGAAHKIWSLGRFNVLGCTLSDTGDVRGTGVLGRFLRRLELPILLYFQWKLGRPYKNLARFRGKKVTYLIYPPTGSRSFYRTVKTILNNYTRFLSPSAATLAVTYHCPCGCFHCSARRSVQKDRPELSTTEFKAVIDQCLDMGISVITFTGGEPLVRKDIFELIEYVDKKKAVTVLFTNGLLLDRETAQKLKRAGLYALFVSFDSDNAEEHNRCRGYDGIFEAAVAGVKNAQDAGLLVGLSSYCSRSNVEKGHHLRMHQLAQRLGLLTVLLFDAIPAGSLLRAEDVMLTPEQHRELADHTDRVLNQGVVPPLASQSWQNTMMGYLSGIGCFAGFIMLYITAYGDVAPCDFTPLSFGNIRNEPLREIWKKLIGHPAYAHRSIACRMQHPEFRKLYIDPIPEGSPLPYPMNKHVRLDYRKASAPGAGST